MEDAAAYKTYADSIMTSLGSPAYRAALGTNGNFILMHSVGSIPHNSEIDVPLNYADYYFMEALKRKEGVRIEIIFSYEKRYEMDMRAAVILMMAACNTDRQMNGSWSGRKTLTSQTGWIRQTGQNSPLGTGVGKNTCLTVNSVMIWLTVILF